MSDLATVAADIRDRDIIHACKSQHDLEGFVVERVQQLDHFTLLTLSIVRSVPYGGPGMFSQYTERRTAFLANDSPIVLRGRKPVSDPWQHLRPPQEALFRGDPNPQKLVINQFRCDHSEEVSDE